jgi:hypothetical protein
VHDCTSLSLISHLTCKVQGIYNRAGFNLASPSTLQSSDWIHGHPRLLTRVVHLAYHNCGTFRFALHLPKEFPKTLVCGENEDWQEGGRWTTCTQDTMLYSRRLGVARYSDAVYAEVRRCSRMYTVVSATSVRRTRSYAGE